ncbi:type I polyketide synthase [Streptacidiphilus sp. P02-A3a]|uniref:type I polyketide synthase n=1 Tax=Streptacidiphilus sp. P02-A3a TaxID=2704468 RepID=UPI0015FA872E|nr:type I polyketide synthase [Streptacidiphilus sp. P02-A3a]QMU69826.1 SDR family NAD(P)-dependent oxidoreductase [Streptacidiphilus sp. P02-A3a]
MDSQEKLFDYLKKASAELQETRKRLRRMEAAEQEPIAIVSLGCRYPGGIRDPQSFWDVVVSGTDAIAGFPNDRGWEAYRDSAPEGTSTDFAHQGGFVYDAAEFDAGFFGISPREALAMDPQQRLLLEVAWESLERARIEPRSLRGSSTGVFVGASFVGYGQGLVEADTGSEGYLLTGSQTAMISGRVAYTLGLEGPALTVDTACSSSLVALHLACQALRSGDCSLALAGGVVVMVTPGAFAEFSKQQGMAADGRSKAFAGAADGMGWGEGAGLLVLERLSDARRNGHPVLALIAGTAANQDGASNGLTAPNGPSQQRVIREALTNARVRSDQVDVVEAHGTGTVLGDPIEAQAILATYGQSRPEGRPLWLGSVKSNIGHTQAAGGVAGVIKMVLAMQHDLMPRTLHVDVPTPKVDWSVGDVQLLTEAVPWPVDEQPRRAGVSAFGASGTNVHVIVQEAPKAGEAEGELAEGPAPEAATPAAAPVLSEGTAWLVSSRTANGLRAQAERLAEFTRHRATWETQDLTDIGWSLATTRSVFEHRAVVRGANRDELLSGLTALAADQPAAAAVSGVVAAGRGRSRVAFVFPGQGSQWVGMGRELVASSPVFAARLAECEGALAPFVDWSLVEVLAGVEGAPGFDRVDVVQPVLWAVMVSLAAVWQAAGVEPDAVVGHSQGEIAAAVVAGILSLEDAAKVVALRSQALTALSGRGGMLSLAESAAAVTTRVAPWADQVSVAAVNGPAATVVSGTPEALREILAACEHDGVRARLLPVDYASHGPQVDELREEILGLLAGITPQPARLPMVSAMTGELLEGPELDAGYWYASLRAPVEFARAVEVLARSRYGVFVETSAHPVLTTSITAAFESLAATEQTEGLAGPAPVVTGTLRRDDGGAARLLASLSEAHVQGVAVDWTAVLPAGQRIELPTYAFQRQHFWPEPVPATAANGPAALGEHDSAAQARFWAAVENGDVDALADTLALDGERLNDVVPALASWRRRERDDAATGGWRYRVSWTPVPDPASAALHGTWLVVAPSGDSETELRAACLRALTARGAEVRLAEALPGAVDQASLAARITDALAGTPQAELAGVVSLLALDATPLPEQPLVTSGVGGTLGLVQALGAAGISAPLWVLTSGAVATAPGELLTSPTQAQVWGLGRVAGLEHPDRWGGLIDLPPVLDARAANRLGAVLAGCGEDQVAIRAAGIVGRRLVRTAPSSSTTPWQPRGTVLVTGVSGEIGPKLAHWLADAGARRLTLVSRRGPMVPGAAAVAAALATAGTPVTVAVCDVTDRDAVAGLLDWIDRSGPALSTVFHGAMAVELLTLADTGPDQLELALGAKVTGATHLDELTADLELDEFVLFSSIAAIWGVSEHGAYAAANAHLDALAENRRARGLPATSVAWGVWDTGQESHEGDRAISVIPERLRRQGLRLLDPERALSALGQVLADDETALSVADVDWPRFSAVFNSMRSWRLLDEIPEARQAEAAPAGTAVVTTGEAAELLGRLVGATPGQRERVVTELVRAHAAAVLGHASLDAVDSGQAFRDMGFDSLTAVELRSRLNQATGLTLPSTVVFDYPSPQVLAQQILTQLLGSQQLAPTASRVTPVASGDPVVIVGIGCRFPGGIDSPEAMWQLLATGGDAIGGFPADRGWDLVALLDATPGRTLTSYTTEGGFVAGAADFDPAFFRISPREALAMDPQQRLLLETSWEALEHAGLDPVSLRGSLTGVFAGAAASGYAEQAGFDEESAGHLITGNVTSVISGRISYTLGLEGPAVTVDTACSSSLVALHLAAQALRAGECDLALAGGVMVITNPGEFIGFSQQGALAADGRCKAFAAEADGMGLAEGAGMLLLERLSDARRNGHTVLATVAGSAVNQDGASNGLSAPNGPSQQRVIRAALANAGLEPGDVDAVEGHGTGTRLGDPIEAQAILATYGQDRPEGRPVLLGSVKSNIGHAQQAAGAAGVIKMVLALRHGLLPATLHADAPSPQVDWSTGDVRLLSEAADWQANGRPRRAGVSAFGISGTNAHMILEEAPTEAEAEPEPELSDDAPLAPPVPVPVLSEGTAWLVSSQTATGLTAAAHRLRHHLAERPELNPVDVGWSLATTRSTFEHRAVIAASDSADLLAGLSALAAERPAAALVSGVAATTGEVVFVFPGQGSQWVGMGRELAASSPVFAARLAECERALAPYVDWSLADVLAGVAGAPGFDRVDVVQPVLWAVMVSLAAVWQAAGVRPDAVVGHSQGEIAAAVVAGILSLEDAARVVALRSRVLIALSGRGGMLSLAESSAAVTARVAPWADRVSVAAVNGPGATVVSGDPEALAGVLAAAEVDGVRARMLPVDYASHGPQVDELREEILKLLAGIAPQSARVPMVSAMTGEFLEGPELDAGYWYASLRAPVEFSRAVEVLGRAGYGVFVESSAHPVLTSAISDTLEGLADVADPVVSGTLRRDDGGSARLLASLAEVHVRGVVVDWAGVLPEGVRVGLPTYAFQRQRYWPKPVAAARRVDDVAATAEESAFWAAVTGGDLDSLAQTLAVDGERLQQVLPALAAWRQRERGKSAVADWRYRILWTPLAPLGRAALSGTWLVVAPAGADHESLTAAVSQALTDGGAEVLLAEIPAGEVDRSALAARITAVTVPVAGVLSLLALDESPLAGTPVVARGLAGTMGLVQALGDAGTTAPLWALTSGATASGDAPVAQAQAQTWAFGRVVALEHPDRWGGLIDLAPTWDARTAERLVAVLAGCGEDQVAIRANGVLGRRMVRAARSVSGGQRWRPGGSVLITGGTGGVGGHVARWLTEREAPRVVLSSRSGPGAAGAVALAAELAAAGTAVDVLAGDVGDRAQTAGLLAWIDAHGPGLSSVMHAAGAALGGPLELMTPDDLAAVLQAKAGGAAYLDELTADRELDAFVGFSSGASTWGSAQLSGYAAANAALDALVEDRRARGLAGTSVAWGLWGGGGMGEGVAGEVLQRLGVREMDAGLAVGALAAILDAGEDLVTVSDIDWDRFATIFTVQRPSRLLADLPEAQQALTDTRASAPGAEAVVGTELGRRLTGLDRAEQERILTDLVRSEAAAVLGHASADAVPPARAFKDLGFDSLTAVDLRTRLNTATGLKLPATLVFDYPTPAAAVQFLRTELLGILADSESPVAARAAADPGEPIAIVGMGCRFPGGVREPEDLWDLLATGTDAIAGFPTDRGWDVDGIYAGLDADTSTALVGGFVYDAADFDPGFFGISPREAITMDPQQRLLLETAWEAVERAGIDPASLKGTATGVFAGAAFGGYGMGLAEEPGTEGYMLIGGLSSVISGRVSYTLGLEGPAVTVDTACSSALVALHLACQALRAGECSMAMAGGVAIMATPAPFSEFSRQRGLAFDGRSKAFAADADGIGWGEGAGMLVLERLSDAQRNGHQVLAVVAGSAINQDGASNGITAPNGPSQQKVIRSALANAGLRADEVDAVEAHGTGTVLGDPIEAQALLATYGQNRQENQPLWLGSVKSNIGHTQTAAGVAGIIKMVLALQHQELPRTLHAEVPSPHVDWSTGDVRLLTEPVAWPVNGRPRRAGVSAFGVSGTNVHAILEEAPAFVPEEVPSVDPVVSPVLPVLVGSVAAWPVSARSGAGLVAQAGRLGEFLLARPELGTAEVAWSLVTSRSTFEHRTVVIGADRTELLAGLSAVAAGRPSPGVVSGVVSAGGGAGRVVFVFPGQGSQWVGMGRELAASSPVFAARLAECERALAPFVDWSLVEVLAGIEGAPGFDRVDVVQPVLWAVMVSLAAVWQAAGVRPDAVVGHSQGEIAAAVVAGILSLEDAARVVALRSRVLIALSGRGGMLSLAESVSEVRSRIEAWGAHRVSVAAVNGPGATVVSGDPEALAGVLAAAEVDGVRARMLPVDYASHGPQVDELREEILALLAGVAPQSARVPMVSAMTGEFLEGPELDAGYWYASLRAPVEFSRAVEVLGRAGYGVFVESSAHPVLTNAISDTLDRVAEESVSGLVASAPVVAGTLRRDDGGPARLLASLAEVHGRGVDVDWTTVVPEAQVVQLPTYAFQRQRYWPRQLPVAIAAAESAGTGVEARFWSAVEAGDLDSLSRTLDVDEQYLGEVLPALASWRQRERDESLTADWRYRVTWKPLRDPSPAVLSGTWLLVVPAELADGELAAACARTLSDRGAQVVLAEVAATELDRRTLAAKVGELLGSAPAAGVLSLLGTDETPLADRPLVPAGVAGTLALFQALGDAGATAPMWAVTRGAVTAGATDRAAGPVQAQVWGLGRTIGVEHPDRWGGLIDLPPVLDDRAAARLAGALADRSEDQVAIRTGGLLARRLVRATPRRNGDSAWTPCGTVLLTGASGAIGPDLAAWMADSGVPHAVLCSRRGPETPGAARLAALLAEAGSAVTMAACDVVDREALAGLLAWIPTFAPPLSAVIHGAVAVELMSVDRTDVDHLALALGAKVGGATHLDELTADLDLEAFILFSSISATWGVGEHATYAAANAHLDALAENRRARGLPATSVAWGVWSSGGRFDETDPADAGAEPARPQSLVPERLRRQGLRLLDPERALTVLGQVLADQETVLAVADVDWPQFSAVFNAVRSWPLLDEIPEARQADAGTTGAAVVASGDGAALLERLVGVSPAQRERIVTDLVGSHAAAVLGHSSAEAVDAARAFREMGFDSLTAVDLRGRLNQATGLTLPSTVVFDYPSPAILARQIVTQLLGTQQQLVAESRVVPVSASDPVVIVGMGCRFPGGIDSPEAMWQLLATGGDAIGGFPADRGWDLAGLLDTAPGSASSSATREGGFVAGAADFDPAFFRISPREALAMDPQQRLLLETSWEALEHAGLDPVALRGSLTGVFAGAAGSGYAGQAGFDEESAGHLITGNVTSVISGRISYTLGLEGPAVTVDTACSSALVSLHLAAQALRAGECDLALAGGVMVITDPAEFIGFSQQGALALDGRCKAFSADADGMGLSEGAGMIVLERLSDARRNGHTVLATVAGSAINQDGASNGLSAPNGPSQQRVIRAALANAGIGAADVDAVEGHGTGTRLGDPIEAQAILATYGQDRPEGRPLWLGSVKSNIGHAQQAAGAAGIIKMVLALQHGLLPATLHADAPSPQVDWTVGDVELLTEAVDWKANGHPRRAGVSAFGISGTNAHIILEEPPAALDQDTSDEPGPGDQEQPAPSVLTGATTSWLVSAQTPAGLRAQAARLVGYLSAHPDRDPAAVGWSLATTRSTFEHRAVVTGAHGDDLIAGLSALVSERPAATLVSGTAGATGQVVFVFPGQGSQWLGMGRELAQSSPVFAARLAECERALAPYVDWSLTEVLNGAEGAPGFDRVDVVQPVLWAVMVSLAAVWQAAGVEPDAVVGHSQGEIAAAVVAGALTLEDAAAIVALRSRALIALSGRGGMLSLAESVSEVEARIGRWGDRVSVAAVNGPGATVVSGDPEALAEVLAGAEGVRARMLPVDYASHGPQVDQLREEILKLLAGVAPRPARVPMVSAMTGEFLEGPELDAGYWYASLRAPVEFSRAVEVLGRAGYGVFVESSAHPVLTNAIGDTLEGLADVADPVVSGTLRRDDGGSARLLASLAEVHVRGVVVDWAGVLPEGVRVGLPTYAFQRQRYWPKPVAAARRVDDVAATAEESAFWAAVTGGDLDSLAQTLEVDSERPFSEVLPALAAWRQRERGESAAADWRYRISWTPVAEPAPTTLVGTWLLVTPAGAADGGLTAPSVAALTDRGAEVLVAEIGPGALDRTALRARITGTLEESGDGLPLAGIVSLLALDASPLPESPVVARGLAGTMGLVQALGDAGIDAPLWLLTSGAMVAVAGEVPVSQAPAQSWAFGRVAGLEHPDRWGGLIDLPPTWDARTAERLVAVLAGCGEDQVAIRSGAVLGRRLVRAPKPTRSGPGWKPGGSVLVTGGTGGVGGHVARWLTEREAPRVVLSSRSGPGAAGAVALAAELAAAGTAVDVLAGDVGDRAQTAGLLAWIDAHGPGLSSVLHAAGAGLGGPLDAMVTADLTGSLQAKAGGASYLDELTADRELDAFVLFSSGAAAWGSGQLSGYAAANAALDVLVEDRRARGLVGTSVAWGLWGGGGMGEGVAGEVLQRLGVREMDPVVAVGALAAVMDAGESLIAVSDTDWSRFTPVFTVQRPSPLLADLPEAQQALGDSGTPDAGPEPGGTALSQRLDGLSRPEQDRILTELVRAEAAAVLGYGSVDAVPAERAFKDLGFDSLTAVDLRTRLNAATGLKLPATLVFDYPTPAVLADFIRSKAVNEQTDYAIAVAELKKLQAILSKISWNSEERFDITSRLDSIGQELRTQDEGGAPETDDEFDSATDDEMFDFVEKELRAADFD